MGRPRQEPRRHLRSAHSKSRFRVQPWPLCDDSVEGGERGGIGHGRQGTHSSRASVKPGAEGIRGCLSQVREELERHESQSRVIIETILKVTFGPELRPTEVLGHGAADLPRCPLQRLWRLCLEGDRGWREGLRTAEEAESHHCWGCHRRAASKEEHAAGNVRSSALTISIGGP